MAKEIHLKIGEQTWIAEVPDQDKSVYIVGADSYYGAHLALHWKQHGYAVYGCGQTQQIPGDVFTEYRLTDYSSLNVPDLNFAWIFYCHDAHDGFQEHLLGVQALCDALLTKNAKCKVAYLSSGAIYESSAKSIRENTRIQPHNQYELAVATAENCLQESCFRSQGKLLPYILRCGDIYGTEVANPYFFGLVGRYLAVARTRQALPVPGIGNANRSLLHIADACEAIIKILTMDFPPCCLNLPGETRSMIQLVSAIADKYHVETGVCADNAELYRVLGDDFSPYAGHRSLSAAFFRKCVDFMPVHKFNAWLQSIPA